MLELEFNIFQDKLQFEKQRGYYPTVHCMVNPNGFKFIIRSQEEITYWTTMSFEYINTFAELNEMDPVQAYDMFITNYCTGTLQIESDEDEEEDEPMEYTGEEEYKKLLEIDAGNDMVIEAKDYSEFLMKFFNKMEGKINSAIDAIDKTYTKKNMGKFLQDLFNGVNTIAFGKQVKKYIKADLVAGMVSAETELDSQIGFTEAYEDKLNVLASNQIDGYTINGKKWPGIKGVTKEIQAKVIQTVQEGLSNKTSLKDIKERVGKEFSEFSEWRSEMIARTETNRIINEGKLTGYKEIGMDGGKIAMVALDNRTTDICKRMHKKYGNNSIGLDDPFIDDKTKKSFIAPPFHVNCRSTIAFRAK